MKTTPLPSPEQNSPDSVRSILEERARRLARKPEPIDLQEGMLELAAFHLVDEFLGIPTSLVREIQPLAVHHWSPIPGAPPFVTGIVNLRGHIYSIIDLVSFHGLPNHPPTEKAHILLVQGGRCPDGREMELTLLADDLPIVRTVFTNQLKPAPITVTAREYVHGVTADMLIVLDLARLLSDPNLVINDLE
jgi:purine-binding chemotaxis protein CheW